MKGFFRWCIGGLALWALIQTASLRAQDIAFAGYEWLNPQNAPDTLPVLRGHPRARVPDEMKALAEPAYAELALALDEKGKIVVQVMHTTSLWLEKVLSAPDARLEFKPATRAGNPVPGELRCFFIFNPASAKANASESSPRLLRIHAPNTNDLKKEIKVPTTVYVKATVDVSGRVTQAEAEGDTPPALVQAAVAAVKTWEFAPAETGHAPTMETIRVPVLFYPTHSYAANQLDRQPKVVKQDPPIYPMVERISGFTGEVLVSFVVSPTGHVWHAEIAKSNNPGFNDAAIECVLKWEFEPGIKNGQPVNTRMVVPIIFQIQGQDDRDLYAIESNRKAIAKLPENLQVDYPPRVINGVNAVYPFALLQQHTEGSAELVFYVTKKGNVLSPQITTATAPEFGQAALAMIDQFAFQPASKDGKPTLGVLKMKVEFSDVGGNAPLKDSARDLLAELKRKEPRIATLSQVDAKPVPISQHGTVFPSVLQGKVSTGNALIQFYIDKQGYAQLPQIISASEDAFGYSAAQAVSSWRFKPLTRNGKPVFVRAQIPFKFELESEEPPAANGGGKSE